MGAPAEVKNFLRSHLTSSGRTENKRARHERAVNQEVHDANLTARVTELTVQMGSVEVFPGSKAELEELRQAPYEFIDVPAGFIQGTTHQQAEIMHNYGDTTVVTRGSIFEQAVNVGADAVVHFSSTNISRGGWQNGSGLVVFMGSPVKKVDQPINSPTQ